jgi:Ca2+/Na+ antiporter
LLLAGLFVSQIVPFIVSRLFDEQNRDVGKKLGIATALMFTLPFVTYYATYHTVFSAKDEPSNWAGGAAVLVTNLIIACYVIVAFSEPEDDNETEKRGNAAHYDNDSRRPRTGIFKQRLD